MRGLDNRAKNCASWRAENRRIYLRAIEAILALEERMELDSPVELLDSLLFIMGVMLDQLIVRAQSRILALASITLHLDLEGGTSHTRTVRPALPNNDRKLWLKLIHLELQAHPPQAAILSAYLERTTRQHQQSAAWTFFSASTRAYAAGCHPGADSQHCRRGLRGSCGAQRHASPGCLSPRTFCCALFDCAGQLNRERGASPCGNSGQPEAVTVIAAQPATGLLRLSARSDTPSSVLTGPGLQAETGGDLPSGRWSNGTWSPRAHDASSDHETWLCCCLTRDLTQERWQVEALYD